MTNPEKQDVIDQLTAYDGWLTKVLNLIGDRSQLRGDEKRQAQELLKEVKANLEADCKALDRREDEWNDYERKFLEPALRETKAEITVRTNTIPGSEWKSNLNGARINITSMLHELEN